MEKPPPLKLIMLKGPREGETLEYKPGSTIRIGRVVKGNNLSIKDAGISTQHCRIVPESGKWVIVDLGSSNGTTINSTDLSPDTNFELSNGDIIKLGGSTSIVVEFIKTIDLDVSDHHPPRSRRNARREAVGGKSNVASSVATGSRVLKQNKTKEVTEGFNDVVKENVEKRVSTRARKNIEIIENKGLESREDGDVVGAKIAGRGRKKNVNISQDLGLESKQSEILENSGLESREAEVVVGKITRGRKKNVEIPQNSAVESEEAKVEVNKIGRGGKRKIATKPPQETEDPVMTDKDDELASKNSDDNVEKGSHCVPKMSYDNGKKSAVSDGNKGGEGMQANLESMTLGQWLEYLEVYLPMQIAEETEKLIDGMKQKSDRVREYIVAEKKKKEAI